MEIWRAVVGYEGLYEVSNYGNILSLNYRNTGKARLMKPSVRSNGYLQVCLSSGNRKSSIKVHRIVAEAFISNEKGYSEINHIDECKTNNHADNLEWCSRKHNINHSHSQAVVAKDSRGNVVSRFISSMEAGRAGFSQSSISLCCRGLQRKHMGLFWEYEEEQ